MSEEDVLRNLAAMLEHWGLCQTCKKAFLRVRLKDVSLYAGLQCDVCRKEAELEKVFNDINRLNKDILELENGALKKQQELKELEMQGSGIQTGQDGSFLFLDAELREHKGILPVKAKEHEKYKKC